MQAVVQKRYGDPEDLVVREVPMPVPRADEVLIRVHAASLHADVWHVIAGHPRFLRLMGNGLLRPKHLVPGTDVAGVVEAVGADVRTVDVGDEVMAKTLRGHQWRNGGAWAEYAAAPAGRVTPRPANVSFAEAACVPTTGLIALDLLFQQGMLADGASLLVNGAGGAVGSMVVQVAKAHGAHVTAVDAPAKQELLRRLGADVVVDYTRHDVTRVTDRYDLIVDVPGNHPWASMQHLLLPGGRYVLVGHDGYDRDSHRWMGAMGKMVPLLVRAIRDPRLPGFRDGRAAHDVGRRARSGGSHSVVRRRRRLRGAPR